MYKIIVLIPFGKDDTYACEYTGNSYSILEEAEQELQLAFIDSSIIDAWIDGEV